MQPLPAEQPLLQLAVAVRVGVSKLVHLLGPTWKETRWWILVSRRRLWYSCEGRGKQTRTPPRAYTRRGQIVDSGFKKMTLVWL